MRRQSTWARVPWLRLIGLGLLGLLLWRVDIAATIRTFGNANLGLVLIVLALDLLLVLVKSVRWLVLMVAQGIQYSVGSAYLAYFGSVFIGLLTPGRLGEFVKTLHVSQDCEISTGRALSSVLADRLFDLYMLLGVGGAALIALAAKGGGSNLAGLALLTLCLTVPLAIFLHEGAFSLVQRLGLHLGRIGQHLFGPQSWVLELRSGLQQLSLPWVVGAMALTVLAYAIFFGQCYLLALALGLRVGFVQVSYTVALGSLVTLLPISISGLGTREAAIVAYLGTVGVPTEAALGFSLLVFVTFYIAGGLMGALAWWIKPVPLKQMPARSK